MKNQSKVIAFDDVSLQLGNTGIARYWKELMQNLIRSDAFEKLGVTPIFLSRSNFRTTRLDNHLSFPEYDFRFPAADRELISAFCKSQNVDLFVSSYYTFSTSCQNLLLVYDLIPEVFGFERLNRGWMERELAIQAASSYFAISENTKSDLRRFYPHSKDLQIDIGYPGIDLSLFDPKVFSGYQDKPKYPRYFVCVGSRYGEGGYKNGELLVEAIQNMNSEDIDFELHFIGGEELTNDEAKLRDSGKIKIKQMRLSDKDLVSSLINAEALIYPSKYEGFGMPPLEALAVGTPVITTGSSSLPESVGDLGIQVGAEDFQSLANLLKFEDFSKWRNRIVSEGPLRAKKFSWDETARSFTLSLQKALDSEPSASSIQRLDFLREYSRIEVNLQY